MKARVKATGEIIDVRDCDSVFYDGAFYHGYVDINRNKYLPNDLEFDCIDGTPPDYWDRLLHQYAGIAMQGILSNQTYTKNLLETSTSAKDARDIIVDASFYLATALIKKQKEKEEKK